MPHYATAIVAFAAASLSCAAYANVLKGLEAYAKDPVKGVIDDAEHAGEQLIANGQGAANGLISHGGMEIDAAARSAVLGLGADLNKTVEDLDLGEQNVILSIVQLEAKGKNLLDGAYDLRDTTVVDLTDWQRNWIFTHAPDFFVQAIKGTALLPQPGDYHITVSADGFGISSDSRAEIHANLNGADVNLSEVDQESERGNAIIAVPNAVIAPLFKPDSLQVVTMNLTVTISRKHLFGWSSHKYDFPVHLLLYPARVATVTARFNAPTYGWVAVNDVLSNSMVTQDKNGCRYCDASCTAKNDLDVPVPGGHVPPVLGDERIVGVRLECTSGSICAFSTRKGTDIEAGGLRARAHFETCTHPTQWDLRASVQQWEQIGDPQVGETVNIDIDSPQMIPLPADTQLLSLDVISFTKQKYTFFVPGSDPHGVVNATMPAGARSLLISAVPVTNFY